MKVLDRGILHREHDLPELPDDVTIPDDLSGLEHREVADRRRPATAIRWMRWLPLFLLVAVGAIVLSVESTGDETQTIAPSAVPWEDGRGPGGTGIDMPVVASSVSSWPAVDGPWANTVGIPVSSWPAGDGPWSNSLIGAAVTPTASSPTDGSWPVGDGPWSNSLTVSVVTPSALPWAQGQGPGSNSLAE